ncbi:ThiF family adenylyltransferase [Methylobacterium sp. Leaf100]|uniref:ThiF family adenylyltransferase n=1 Tax=Methylobacterium sp. Leaf100 TaxID=1736252 RepID=UPI0006F538A9|nr:ThiF family adenylyltransferase [Methylobacterium sp. Leaf100]KQP32825.1 hypothetical protein ASF25_17560 [Methylobacterium sp. Leaf100]
MRYTATILQHHHDQLFGHLIRPDGLERVAVAILGRSRIGHDPWRGDREERFVTREILPVPDEVLLTQSGVRVRWPTSAIQNAAKAAEQKGLAVALIHSHPGGSLCYSELDDAEEPGAIEVIFNRNGGDRPHLSLLMDGDGEMIGRAYDSHLRSHPLSMLRVIGERFRLRYPGRDAEGAPMLDRQRRAFGRAFCNDMRALRIGVVGCGATGSATVALLMRLGAGHLALFDNDVVDRTNLNRLHFARQSDADLGTLKVDVVAREVAGAGLGVQVRAFPYWVGDPRCRDALKACDIVFGCTDDHQGRGLMNSLAYAYGIPVIDMGILMKLDAAGTAFDVLDGRVTVLTPGNTCLLCRGLIDPARMRAEALKRNDPEGYERERAAGYLPDEGEPAPAVVSFTTEVASMAVNEMIHRLQGFRGEGGAWAERVRQFHVPKDFDIRAGKAPVEGCRICHAQRLWGRGDMEPFLDQVS